MRWVKTRELGNDMLGKREYEGDLCYSKSITTHV